MLNSILHFIENDIKEIENLVAAMLKGEKEPYDLSQDIHDRMLGLGARLINCWISWGLSGSAGLATGIRKLGNSFTSWIKSLGLKDIRGSRLGRPHAFWKRRYRPATLREAGPYPLWGRSANRL